MERRRSNGVAVLALAALISATPGCVLGDDCDCHERAPPGETELQRGLREARRAECEKFHRDLDYAEEQAKRERAERSAD